MSSSQRSGLRNCNQTVHCTGRGTGAAPPHRTGSSIEKIQKHVGGYLFAIAAIVRTWSDMGLRKEYVRLLSAKLVDDLVKQEMIEVPEGIDLAEQIFQVMDAEINLEDRINEEVRTLLNQYGDQMRQSGASYQEMFKLIKNKLVKERKIVL